MHHAAAAASRNAASFSSSALLSVGGARPRWRRKRRQLAVSATLPADKDNGTASGALRPTAPAYPQSTRKADCSRAQRRQRAARAAASASASKRDAAASTAIDPNAETTTSEQEQHQQQQQQQRHHPLLHHFSDRNRSMLTQVWLRRQARRDGMVAWEPQRLGKNYQGQVERYREKRQLLKVETHTKRTQSERKTIEWNQHRWYNIHGHATKQKRQREHMKRLRTWWDFLDADGGGTLSVDELEDPLVSVGLATGRADVEKLIERHDTSGEGELDWKEFVNMVTVRDVVTVREAAAALARAAAEAKAASAAEVVGGAGGSPAAPKKGHATGRRGKKKKEMMKKKKKKKKKKKEEEEDEDDEEDMSQQQQQQQQQLPDSSSTTLAALTTTKYRKNALMQLFDDMEDGKFGNRELPLPVQITAYRRQMLMQANMSHDAALRKKGMTVLKGIIDTKRNQRKDLEAAAAAAVDDDLK